MRYDTIYFFSFEQFCINYCNERLQQMFINSVLKKEQEVYRSEGVEWVHINFQDNAPIYTMIEVASTRERGRERGEGGRLGTCFQFYYQWMICCIYRSLLFPLSFQSMITAMNDECLRPGDDDDAVSLASCSVKKLTLWALCEIFHVADLEPL